MSWFGAPPGDLGPQATGLDLYHVGVVVPDVRAAMEQYSALLGMTWTRLGDSTLSVLVDGERRQARIAATYSQQGPPYLELVEELSGGVWATGALGLHHVGLWTDDLEGSVRRLEQAGMPGRVRHAPAEGEPALFSYHEASPGMWWELVGEAFRPRLQRRLDEARGAAT